MKKKILVMLAVLSMAVGSLAGCSSSSSRAVSIPKVEDTRIIKTDKKTLEFDSEGFAQALANDNYELSIDKKYSTLNVKQISTGAVWTTAVENSKAEADRSLFQLSYYNASAREASPAQRYSSRMTVDEALAIKDNSGNNTGIRLVYKDSDLALKISVDIYLTDEGLQIQLPMGGVVEEGDYKVISIALLQNLTAARNTEEGYYLYPDGCGAVMEFQDSSHENENAVEYKVYGNIEQYKNMLGEWDEEGEDVFLPIFGAKIADKSFLAIIKEGEETASVNIVPKAEAGLNKMYCTFTYRNLFNDVRKDKDGQDIVKNRYDTNMVDVTRTVRYDFFEAGEDVTYADMAVRYREYLLEECGIEKKSDDTLIPVSMNIFMGINEEGTIRDEFKAVTTFEEAERMIDELKKKELGSMEVQLKGWTKNGYFTDPVQFPVNSDIGGTKGLKSFTDKYKSDGGVKVSLETNLLEAKADADGYDDETEVVTAGNYNVVTDAESKTYVLSPNVAAGNLNQLIEDIQDSKAAIDGMSFYSLGQYVTWNYRRDNAMNKAQCKQIWKDMLKTAKGEYKKIIVQGGNQYVLEYADKVTDIPYDDSGYRMTTRSVPVFQIAVHGLVNYTGNALNLSSDTDKEILKWVEYGYMPFFELTYNGSEELMHTDYSELFSSTFSSWADEATEVYKDFNKNLSDVWNEYIVDHEEVQDDVFKVTYENGKVVYVNYNDVECKVDGNVIDANSYLVK